MDAIALLLCPKYLCKQLYVIIQYNVINSLFFYDM